jgi:hypothetical protein
MAIIAAMLENFAVKHFGFGIARSMALLCIAILIVPGTLLLFFYWNDFNKWLPMLLATIVNGAYCRRLIWLLQKLVLSRKMAKALTCRTTPPARTHCSIF